MEDSQRVLTRLFHVYADGITDVSWIAETLAQEYGIPFSIPRIKKNREEVIAAVQQTNLMDLSREPLQEYLIDLLEIKYAALLKADTVFAFGDFTDDCKMLRGATGWCVQMAADMGKTVYVYDIESRRWFDFKNNQFCLKQELPELALYSVILGSKYVGPKTNHAIQTLFHKTFSTYAQELVRRLEEFNL